MQKRKLEDGTRMAEIEKSPEEGTRMVEIENEMADDGTGIGEIETEMADDGTRMVEIEKSHKMNKSSTGLPLLFPFVINK